VGFDDPPRLARDASNDEEAMPHYRRVRDEIRDFIASIDTALPRRANDANGASGARGPGRRA